MQFTVMKLTPFQVTGYKKAILQATGYLESIFQFTGQVVFTVFQVTILAFSVYEIKKSPIQFTCISITPPLYESVSLRNGILLGFAMLKMKFLS